MQVVSLEASRMNAGLEKEVFSLCNIRKQFGFTQPDHKTSAYINSNVNIPASWVINGNLLCKSYNTLATILEHVTTVPMGEIMN